MANWCMNYLRVTGPVEDVARFQQQAATPPRRQGRITDEPPEAFSFERLVPLSAKRRTPPNDAEGGDNPREEWGCRSDAFHSELVEAWAGGVAYRFVTPWNPPTRFFQRVSECWPSLIFVLDYEEPRVAFRGLAHATNGVVQSLHLDLATP